MHPRSGSALARTIVTALLLLAVSPVTSPFLTFDLKNLYGDSTAPGVALVQPKTTHDEPVSTVVMAAASLLVRHTIAPATSAPVCGAGRHTAFLPPLRI